MALCPTRARSLHALSLAACGSARRVISLCSAGAVLLLLGCDGTVSQYQQRNGEAMGTSFAVTAHCPDPLGDRVEVALERVEADMSTWRSESLLSRINSDRSATSFALSEDLAEVIDSALAVHQASGGAFDVTVSELVRLWGFGPDRAAGLPDTAVVAEALAQVGSDALSLVRSDGAPPTLQRSRYVEIDLSAIAKGFGVDKVAAALDDAGCSAYLVEVGGEVRTRGISPSGRAWRVGVEVPTSTQLGALQRVLELESGALATSGDYRNFTTIDGVRYSHTIDPRTGRPVEHELASVTVVHDSATEADAYATALLVLGTEAGFELALANGLAALFVERVVDGADEGFVERYTPQMRGYLLP